MKQVPSKPTFPRADPEQLKHFDPRTKMCVMNCGPSSSDPRDAKERKFLCEECVRSPSKGAGLCYG